MAMWTLRVQYWITIPAALMLFGVTMRYLAKVPHQNAIAQGTNAIYSLENVVPAQCEPERGVDEPRRVPREALLVREVRSHLAECDHDHVAHKADEAVSQEDTERTSADERGARADNETGPDGTSQL